MGLGYKVFFSKRAGVSRATPSGNDYLKWVPTTSTLIYGKRDAILVDTQLTRAASKELVEWVVDSGMSLTTIYITHAHADHFYGNAALIKRFPGVKIVATPEVMANMAEAMLLDGMDAFWRRLFPGLVVVRIGHTNTDEITAFWVPSIGLAVAGDSVYNNTHLYLGESARLKRIAALHLKIVVGGHNDLSKDFSLDAIHETKAYLEDFERINKQTTSAKELYSRMLELHPNRLNVGSL
ncbi:metallo-beta-lactamase domain protein [Leptodontidium sp. MPI-SDFR-AT-0119]|nr:metallo-beta-lactamase domain protein [Leptodontidium sp. MPI-SDFR-AT-0119]